MHVSDIDFLFQFAIPRFRDFAIPRFRDFANPRIRDFVYEFAMYLVSSFNFVFKLISEIFRLRFPKPIGPRGHYVNKIVS